ncbi:MAG TPA: ABC transporter permease [Nocardioides sp.]|uniref:sugar ABC transporter permease n=1 Tax=Nocardioides sp. TaxID=35761 RepID=UPI002E3815DC|nr:ABC transporter permease [Nocardioides sp.]HEX5090669.1 ABC transporter permease [Nocardioides sp.]
MTTPTTQATDPHADEPEVPPSSSGSLGDIVRAYFARLRGGDLGSLPAVLGLIVLVAVFSALRPERFPSAFNIANLLNQSAAVVVLAMGLVFVLLLGEIDLSAGFTGGTAAAVTGVVMTNHGWGWIPSLLTGLATGAVIGTVIGLLVARLGIPSFVVTLAFFLGLQGVVLVIIGEGGTIAYRNEVILKLNNDPMPVWLGWTIAVVGLALYAILTWRTDSRRRRHGLEAQPVLLWAIKTGALVVLVLAFIAFLSQERSPNPTLKSIKGVPLVVAIIVALLVVLTYLLDRTAWGRHIYAVGGNAEASRRSGISVARIKLTCFITCSTMAAVAGLLIASRNNSASPTTGGGTFLLYGVGAAVIGGTSLFGGKGRVSNAIIGGLVISVIDNGMGLLRQSTGNVYMITGLVLLVAASVDAISRRQATASGRA